MFFLHTPKCLIFLPTNLYVAFVCDKEHTKFCCHLKKNHMQERALPGATKDFWTILLLYGTALVWNGWRAHCRRFEVRADPFSQLKFVPLTAGTNLSRAF